MSKIIAVDFDGTIFTNAWPDIGEPIKSTIDALKREQRSGSKIILWTNRMGDKLQEAIDACKKQGIEFDAVNDNLPEIIEAFGDNCRKIFANEYWDDRAIKATKDGLEGSYHTVLINPNPDGDTRTADENVTFEQFQKANDMHIDDVRKTMDQISIMVQNAGARHDWTKKEFEREFYRDFKDTMEGGGDFTKKEWYLKHIRFEDHHPLSYCSANLDLVDILEMVADCVCAGKARSGKVMRLVIPNYILQRAMANTWDLVESMVELNED